MVEDGVFLTPEFKKFSEDYVMFLHVTTMIEGRKDDDLLARIGGTAFPHLAVMDVDGTVIQAHTAAPTVDAFRTTAARGRERLELRARADEGERDAIIKLMLGKAAVHQITAKRMQREIARAGELTPEEQHLFKQALTELRFAEAEVCALGAWFLDMEKEGLIPASPEQRTRFYLEILKWAEFQEEVTVYQRALEEIRKLHGDERQAASFFEMAAAKMEELKEVVGK